LFVVFQIVVLAVESCEMTGRSLGRLEQVQLRYAWQTEAGDFTPWLANEANISILADTLGLQLEVVRQEAWVGPFRADIVCRDTLTDELVLIENQLERTDHTHLGQLMTYAAGLEAVTVVWIASQFTDEHREALDWLNRKTSSDVNLFGLEIELWQIGDSAPAPKFNVVAKPNEWGRTVRANVSGQSIATATDQLKLAYWTAFKDFATSQHSNLRLRQPRPVNFYDVGLGRTGFSLYANIAPSQNRVSVGIWISPPYAAEFHQLLKAQARAIDMEVGDDLDWSGGETNIKSKVIWVTRPDWDPANQCEWPVQHRWLLGTMEKLHRAIVNRVQALPSLAEMEAMA
jgi:hypothetical protein